MMNMLVGVQCAVEVVEYLKSSHRYIETKYFINASLLSTALRGDQRNAHCKQYRLSIELLCNIKTLVATQGSTSTL